MPFGSIGWSAKLGIANTQTPKASSFASTVLRLPNPNFFVYQQQLVHSTAWTEGPAQAAQEYCGNVDNNEIGNVYTIREISPINTQFARRNITFKEQYRQYLLLYRNNYYNQIFYVMNEPDFYSLLSRAGYCDCWDPPDRGIDPIDPPDQYPLRFWNYSTVGWSIDCGSVTDFDFRRISPDALAYAFLRLKRVTEIAGHNHVVLPPAAANTVLGYADPYWESFYTYVHNGINNESGITPGNLKALHIHHYSLKYQPSYTPLAVVGWDAVQIRHAADWYRSFISRYGNYPTIPADILISEMGYDWTINRPTDALYPQRYAGGWPSFRQGLNWWNSWLHWLTRPGPMECNLQGWNTGQHTIHASIHEPSTPAYVTEVAPNSYRTQMYLNASDGYVSGMYIPVIEIPGLQREAGSYGARTFENFFTALTSINWSGHTWRSTPFGVCYAVWARVGPDGVTENLDTGWVSSTQAGVIGTAHVQLPAGYNTVCFPIIKYTGAFPAGTRVQMKWIRSDGVVCVFGYMDMGDFDDSQEFNENGLHQHVMAAMVFPVVCYSSAAKTVTVELSRNTGGTQIWLGRPLVLKGACSWFVSQ